MNLTFFEGQIQQNLGTLKQNVAYRSTNEFLKSSVTFTHFAFCLRRSAVAFGIAASATGVNASARAENTRQTVEWQQFDEKDPLTDKVTQRPGAQVKFPDGNMVQVFAKCAEPTERGKYPGLNLVIGTFDVGTSPKPYAWQKSTIELPLVIDDRPRPAVHAYTQNPRANVISVGFYDPGTAKRLTHVELSRMIRQIEAAQAVANMKQEIEWTKFVAGAGGTLAELLQASSIRVQLPLEDGGADVLEINPRDATLKTYAQQCNAQFQTRAR